MEESSFHFEVESISNAGGGILEQPMAILIGAIHFNVCTTINFENYLFFFNFFRRRKKTKGIDDQNTLGRNTFKCFDRKETIHVETIR